MSLALAVRSARSERAGRRPDGERRYRAAPRRTVLAAALTAAIVTAACAPPTGGTGAGDGGVPVTTPATTASSGPIDVALTDTRGLAAPMALTPFANSAPAGDVTFNVKNLGTVEHEMIVLKTDTPFDQIPVTDSGDPPVSVASGADKVDEADNVGETGDPNLAPGDTRTFTIKGLTAGHYVLVCNLAQHYALGMRATFTVTSPTAPAPVAVTLSDSKGLAGPMSLVPSVDSVQAGDVTFQVKNDGTVEHEMIVLKTDTPFDQIPVTDSGDPPVSVASGADKVDEADNVGETGDPNLAPGDTRTFTIKGLTAGHYVLVCNLAQHYALGMRAAFTVT